jgi:hypothetical protein
MSYHHNILDLTTVHHLALRLRMRGTVPTFPHTSAILVFSHTPWTTLCFRVRDHTVQLPPFQSQTHTD